MSGGEYRAVIVGLTGIGAKRPVEEENLPVYGAMPMSHASAYYRCPQTRLTGVCDLREEALDGFRANWNDVWPDMRYYVDYREMLETESPDLVSVATSDHFHADIVVAAAERGTPAILCEKPLATTLEDADRMIAAAEASGTILSVDHSRRWYPQYLKAREIVRSGRIGPLRTIGCEMFGLRSMLFRNGTHALDTVCFFADGDPQWLVADLQDGFEHFTEYQGGGGKDSASDPYASAYIRFGNGVRAFFNSFKTGFSGWRFVLTCEDGRVEATDTSARLIRGASFETSEIVPEHYMLHSKGAMVAELVHLLEHGGEPVSPAREARKSLEVILGILKSHHAGNARVDFPLS